MTLTFGNIYELQFEREGPRPTNSVEMSAPLRISGVSVRDALARWEESRSGEYAPFYPSIVSVTKSLDGVYY